MKKFIVLVALILCATTSGFSQGFKAGLNLGIPVGDASDFSNLQFGADVAYLFAVADSFSVGPMLGYSNFFPEDSDNFDNIQFLPIAASGRLGVGDAFFLGADLGYAVGIDDGNDGGFYYRPQVGYDFGLIGLIASYSGVSRNGGSISSVNLGIEFGL
ncbi:hypothetical protein C7S20_16445 [Christiangramia fulva]|uniref:Outer membrane protein beta-barrel domain-containing protein n=1 Tax=Christiangramia fulva TaxID=2126553 RepID=A0A2R3Z8X6_9FLAO|nr:hypothetical protein [Christiangramia fulva]AVR46726.1 hypothetical protein C7S20_16445 [Christiangramia fulva]